MGEEGSGRGGGDLPGSRSCHCARRLPSGRALGSVPSDTVLPCGSAALTATDMTGMHRPPAGDQFHRHRRSATGPGRTSLGTRAASADRRRRTRSEADQRARRFLRRARSSDEPGRRDISVWSWPASVLHSAAPPRVSCSIRRIRADRSSAKCDQNHTSNMSQPRGQWPEWDGGSADRHH
jgi:hypothetical protein